MVLTTQVNYIAAKFNEKSAYFTPGVPTSGANNDGSCKRISMTEVWHKVKMTDSVERDGKKWC